MRGYQGYYHPGKPATFTPSANSDWTRTFNRLLNNGKWSRNKLTEKLIIEGLRVNNGKTLTIDVSDMEHEQLLFLQSDQGQKILINLLKAMIGKEEIRHIIPVQQPTAKEEEKNPALKKALSMKNGLKL